MLTKFTYDSLKERCNDKPQHPSVDFIELVWVLRNTYHLLHSIRFGMHTLVIRNEITIHEQDIADFGEHRHTLYILLYTGIVILLSDSTAKSVYIDISRQGCFYFYYCCFLQRVKQLF